MCNETHAPIRSDDDPGMTLIEILVVLSILGLLATVIAFTFVAIIRTNPSTEARADDARTVLGLNIYVPEDVNSTPPSGYDFAESAGSGCGGTPALGVSLVGLTWTELSNTYRANYRYIGDSTGYRVVRYACTNGGSPSIINLTSSLPVINEATWTSGTDPVVVKPVLAGTDIVGLTFKVTTKAGEIFAIEGRTNNAASTLPPAPTVIYPPPPAGNQPPIAGPAVVANAQAGATTTISLNGSDPEGDPLTTTITNLAPTGWTVTPKTGLTVDVTPPTGEVAGSKATFTYTITDAYGRTASSTAEITVTAPAPNNPPTAANVTQTIAERAPTVIDLPVADADNDPLTVTVSGVPPSLIVTVSGKQLTITSDGTSATPAAFTYTVSDGTATASGSVSITVTLCQVTALTPASVSEAVFTNGTKKDTLKKDVTFTVGVTGNCAGLVTLSYDNANSGSPQFLTFNPTTWIVTFQKEAETWTNGTTFKFEAYLRGVATGKKATLTIS